MGARRYGIRPMPDRCRSVASLPGLAPVPWLFQGLIAGPAPDRLRCRATQGRDRFQRLLRPKSPPPSAPGRLLWGSWPVRNNAWLSLHPVPSQSVLASITAGALVAGWPCGGSLRPRKSRGCAFDALIRPADHSALPGEAVDRAPTPTPQQRGGTLGLSA